MREALRRALHDARLQYRLEVYAMRETLRTAFGVRGDLRRLDLQATGQRGGAVVQHFVRDGALWASVGASEDEGAERAARLAEQLFRTGYNAQK